MQYGSLNAASHPVADVGELLVNGQVLLAAYDFTESIDCLNFFGKHVFMLEYANSV